MSSQLDAMPEGTWVVQLVVPVVVACCLRAGWSLVGRLWRAVLRAWAASASTSTARRSRPRPRSRGLSGALSGVVRADGSVDAARASIVLGLLVLAGTHLAGLAGTYASMARRDPVDVFVATGLGVYAPTADVRSRLVDPAQQSSLLRRLGSMDGRRAYLLLGRDVFSCSWCRPLAVRDVPSPAGWGDYALYALLGGRLAAAAARAVVLAALTTGPGVLDLLGAAARGTPLQALADLWAPLLRTLSPACAPNTPRSRTSCSAWRAPALLALAALYIYRAAYSTYLSVWYAAARAAAPLDHVRSIPFRPVPPRPVLCTGLYLCRIRPCWLVD